MAEGDLTVYVKGQLYNLNITDLYQDAAQPRKYIDPAALDELTASIRQHGVLEPVLFRQNPDGKLYIVAGERRFAAAQKADLTTIPAIFIEGNYAEISLVENLLRQDLTAVEEAEALKGLMDAQKYTQEQLGSIIGKARTTINEILTLNRLPEEIRSECRNNPSIARATLLEIAKNKQTRSMLTQYNKYKEKLAKQQTGKQKREKTAPVQALTEWLEKTDEKLGSFDVASLTDAEKATLFTTISHLKTTITATLKSLNRANL